MDVLGAHSFLISIESLKKCSVVMFRAHGTSALRATKWHMLDHPMYDLSRIGDVSYVRADIYKSVHKRFNDNYKQTSKRLYPALS